MHAAESDEELGERFVIARASNPDTKRDQNSVILLRRAFFREGVTEHTASVMSTFDKSVPVASGDLLLISAEDVVGRK